MFAVHRTLAPPSAITLALPEPVLFSSLVHRDILVVKGDSLLEAYRPVFNTGIPRLELCGSWPLAGTVTGIAAIDRPPRLLVVFADNKAAIVHYDQRSQRLATASLHAFDHDAIASNLLPALSPVAALLAAEPEPERRCAAVLCGSSTLAVLPFRAAKLAPLHHLRSAFSSSDAPLPSSQHDRSFTLALADQPAPITNAVALAFLHGAVDPTVAILHHRGPPTFSTALDMRRDTAFVSVASLNLSSHVANELYAVEGLPASTFALAALPGVLAGGVLAISPNGVVFLSQTARAGACVNAFPGGGSAARTAVRETGFQYAFDLSHLALHFDDCTVVGTFPLPLAPGASFSTPVPASNGHSTSSHTGALYGGSGRGRASATAAPATGARCVLSLRCGLVVAVDVIKGSSSGGTARGSISAITVTPLFETAPGLTALVPLPPPPLSSSSSASFMFAAAANGPPLILQVDPSLDPAHGMAVTSLTESSTAATAPTRGMDDADLAFSSLPGLPGLPGLRSNGARNGLPGLGDHSNGEPSHKRRRLLADASTDTSRGEIVRSLVSDVNEWQHAAGAASSTVTRGVGDEDEKEQETRKILGRDETGRAPFPPTDLPPKYERPALRIAQTGDSVNGYRVVEVLDGLGAIKDAVIAEVNGQQAVFGLAGHGAGGHLALVQQAIHPTVKNRFKIPGVRKMWTAQPSRSEPHAFLVLSTEARTMVFRSGAELRQVSDTGFVTTAASVHIGTVLGGTRIIQVVDQSILLLDMESGELFHRIDMNEQRTSADASTSVLPPFGIAVAATSPCGRGRHVAVLSRTLTARVYAVQDDRLVKVLDDRGVVFASITHDAVGALSSHKDMANWISANAPNTAAASAWSAAAANSAASATRASHSSDTATGAAPGASNVASKSDELDDLDMDFYGGETPAPVAAVAPPLHHQDESTLGPDHPAKVASTRRPTRDALVLVRTGTGIVELIDLEALAPIFSSPEVHSQPPSFGDHALVATAAPMDFKAVCAMQRSMSGIVQAHIYSLGDRIQDTILQIVTKDATLVLYQANIPDIPIVKLDSPLADRAAIVWTRVDLNTALLLPDTPQPPAHTLAQPLMTAAGPGHSTSAAAAAATGAGTAAPAAPIKSAAHSTPPWISLHPFHNVAGHTGMLVLRGGGGAPRQAFWVLRSAHGRLVPVPMGAQARGPGSRPVPVAPGAPLPMTAFAPFHNVNCAQGFVALTSTGELVLAQLDPNVSLDLGVPTRAVHTGLTATAISFDVDTSTLAVAHCWDEPYTMVIDVPDQQEHHLPPRIPVLVMVPEMLDREVHDGFYAPTIRRFRIDLLSVAHDLAIADSLTFEACEQVTAVHHTLLECKSAASGYKTFLAVGTTFVRGEDVSTGGRIYLYEPITVVPEPGRPATATRLKLQCIEEIKAPVTSLGTVMGHLTVGAGAKVVMYDLDETDTGARTLVGIAFAHSRAMATHLVSVNAYLLVGDATQSVQMFVLQSDPPKLLPLGADHHAMAVSALDAIILGDQVAFLAADDVGAVHMMSYAPFNIQSFGGTRLLRRGDFYMGTPIAKLTRYRMCGPKPPLSFQSGSAAGQRSGSGMGTGSLQLPPAPVLNQQLPPGAGQSTEAQPGPPPSQPGFCNLYFGRDGSIGLFVPMAEDTYKRLLLVYNRLVELLPTNAGLHPKAYRHGTLVENRLYSNNQATMLDLDVIMNMLLESVADQNAYARAGGTTLARIRGDVRALYSECVRF
ncbi:CPSF A subunit region-domain-containing protein [Blastocladiella britannica]|nr:CPSF A subunit region-domain-containing protein [Blastocladiella britannica]